MNALPQTVATRRVLYLIAGLLLVARLIGLVISPLNLGPDEAQYWRWSTDPAWGYYSKPPLIAWVIAVSTMVFGDAEWAVRLPSPILHTLAAGLIFALGKRIFDVRIGAFAAVYYLLMPGVILASGLISTDGVLLPIWALALFSLWSLRETPDSNLAPISLGLALGAGFLAKYAMIYFLLGMLLASLIDRPTRQALISPRGGLALLLTGGIFTPHLFWNFAHDFQTVSHTADNANWGGSLFHPQHGLDFFVNQMGIVGPAGLLVLLTAFYVLIFKRRDTPDTQTERLRWLACFALPALVLILGQAITSRAHANWAASAYISGSLIICAVLARNTPLPRILWGGASALVFIAALFVPDTTLLVRVALGGFLAGGLSLFGFANAWRTMGTLWFSFCLHAVTALTFMVLATGPASWADSIGLGDAFKRARGWEQTVSRLAEAARLHTADAIVFDEREVWHGVDYYGRSGFPVPHLAWRPAGVQKSFAEQVDLANYAGDRLLIASNKPHQRPRIRADFASIEAVGNIEIVLGDGAYRRFKLYVASGYTPLERTPEWYQRFDGTFEN